MESCWQESMRGLSSDKLITSGSADSIKCFTCSIMAVTIAIFDISCAKKKTESETYSIYLQYAQLSYKSRVGRQPSLLIETDLLFKVDSTPS